MDSNQVFVSIQNLAPNQGTRLSPVWVGFHNGEFDTYDRGRPASEGIERIAEDGNTAILSQEFDQSGFGETQGVVPGAAGPIQIGETTGALFTIADTGQGQYFNYASMILPSNDFFIANGNPLAHKIFDDNGKFIGADFIELGEDVLDSGTEVNDEIPENTAFFGQSVPDTGVVEGGVIQTAPGFIEGGAILSSDNFANADFTAEGYEIARIRVLNAITGGSQNETLRGTTADDYIAGLSGNDKLIGRGGNDILLGEQGNDYLAGRFGNDELFGGVGNDTLLGGVGDDTLLGGSGNDILGGEAGQNVLRGGAGDDIYQLDSAGLAVIQGFGEGDRLQLGASLQFDDLTFNQQGRNTLISAGEEAIAILQGTQVETLSESSFI